MSELVYDFETNGLLDRPDLKAHCLVVQDVETEKVWRYGEGDYCADGSISDGLDRLSNADLLIGHNISGFDIPLADLLYPGWRAPGLGRWYDTRLVSRQMFPNMALYTAKFRNAIGGRSEKKREAAYPRALQSPTRLHSLEAWGYRLKFQKDEYLKEMGVQEENSKELVDYCEQDVRVNRRLYLRLRARGADPDMAPMPLDTAIIESQVGFIAHALQERNGVGFNEAAAAELYATLCGKRDELLQGLRDDYFPDWYVGKAEKTPKRTYKVQYPNKLAGRQAGCPMTPIVLTEFIGSTQQIADRLTALYGWVPNRGEFTDGGLPEVTEKILGGLTYEPVPKIIEYLTAKKRCSQIGEGNQAWLAKAEDGVIHGRVSVSGTRTSRWTHYGPNLAQVPKVTSPYGPECRDLFRPTRKGWVQVGVDASGVQLRFLAHRMAYYDGGEFSEVILSGDPHAKWMEYTGIFIRDNQKTWTYATLFGAGDTRRGNIILEDWRAALKAGLTDKPCPPPETAMDLGRASKKGLLSGMPALAEVQKRCYAAHKRGWLRGLDGRTINVQTDYGAINDLLQSDEAILMKHALVEFHDLLTKAGLVHGRDYAFMLNVHDEWQLECSPKHAEYIGRAGCLAITKAGEKLGVRLRLDGEYKVGNTWKETH
jgi:hypothetical protein